MATLREEFDRFTKATCETPTHIVFGKYHHRFKSVPSGLVEWSQVPAQVLDQAYDAGVGITEAPDLCAWSPSWVIFLDQYDGAETLRWVPRHPMDHEPIRPGR